jgi:hypothetical protein
MKIVQIPKLLACLLSLFYFVGGVSADDSGAQIEPTKTCFACNGKGKIKCPNCLVGWAHCPNHCLQLSEGVWEHENVAGHPPTDLWRRFTKADGGWISFSQAHVGDLIVYQNGNPVDIGKCPVCGGTGKVQCPVCKGTDRILCPICDGKKVVPESWTAFDNPKMKNRPVHYQLKDGRIVIGRKIMTMGDEATLRTQNGDVSVKIADIVSEEKPK